MIASAGGLLVGVPSFLVISNLAQRIYGEIPEGPDSMREDIVHSRLVTSTLLATSGALCFFIIKTSLLNSGLKMLDQSCNTSAL